MYQSKYVYHFFTNHDLIDVMDDSTYTFELDRRNKIEDLDNFKRYMEQRNLWTSEFEKELELYLKFNNN